MNMRAALSDDQLLAQRQARLGRSAPPTTPGAGGVPQPSVAPTGLADPGMGRPTVPLRDPFSPMTLESFADDAAQTPAPTPAPAPVAAPAADFEARMARMQQQLDAALGRVAPMQQQLENYRTTTEALQAANARLQAQVEAESAAAQQRAAADAAAAFDPFEGMAADELAMIDPTVADAMRRSARAAVARVSAQHQDPRAIITATLKERDALALKRYIHDASADMQLVELGADHKFQEFVASDDSADMLLNSFVQATDIETAQRLEGRLRKMLKRFRETATAAAMPAGGAQNPDPHDHLAAHLSRTGGAATPGASTPSQRKALTPDQVREIRKQAQALTRQRKHEEANALIDQLN